MQLLTHVAVFAHVTLGAGYAIRQPLEWEASCRVETWVRYHMLYVFIKDTQDVRIVALPADFCGDWQRYPKKRSKSDILRSDYYLFLSPVAAKRTICSFHDAKVDKYKRWQKVRIYESVKNLTPSFTTRFSPSFGYCVGVRWVSATILVPEVPLPGHHHCQPQLIRSGGQLDIFD